MIVTPLEKFTGRKNGNDILLTLKYVHCKAKNKI